ncbi:MAG: hypothetical protein R3B09_21765 [Nannocystaceae bacterium]
MPRLPRSARRSLAALPVLAVALVAVTVTQAAPTVSPRALPAKPAPIAPVVAAPPRLTDGQRLAAINQTRAEKGLAPLLAAPKTYVELSMSRPFDPGEPESYLEILNLRAFTGRAPGGEAAASIRPVGHYETFNGTVYIHARLAPKTLHFVDCRVGPTAPGFRYAFHHADAALKSPATAEVDAIDGHVYFAFVSGPKEIQRVDLEARSSTPTWSLWSFYGCEITAAG